MRRLIYKSEQTEEVTSEVMTNIIKTARASNHKLYITGMLLFNNGSFLQCLEGTQPEIDIAMERIYKASQHKNITLLSDTRVKERYFPDWSMGVDASMDIDVGQDTAIQPRLFPLPDPNEIISGDVAELVLKVYARNKYHIEI